MVTKLTRGVVGNNYQGNHGIQYDDKVTKDTVGFNLMTKVSVY